MRCLYFLLGLSLASWGTESSSLSYGKRTCTGSQGKILKQEGCLIETCIDGFVKESLSEKCLEMIKEIIDEKWEKKIAEKGCSSDAEVLDDPPNVMYVGSKAVELPSFTLLSNCSIFNHPEAELTRAVTGMVDGKIMSCGGSAKGKKGYLSSCYIFDGSTWRKQPSMKYARGSAAASMTDDGWMVTGGMDKNHYDQLKSTEIFSNGSWRQGVELPWAFSGHCQITSKYGVIVAGYHWDLERYNDDDGFTGTLYVGKLEADKRRWKKLSSKSVDMRYDHGYQSCELIGEEKLVVIGGDFYRNNVDIFDLKSNTWSKGPSIPTYGPSVHTTIYKESLYITTDRYVGTVYSIPVSMQGEWKEVTTSTLGPYPDRAVHPAPVVQRNQLGC